MKTVSLSIGALLVSVGLIARASPTKDVCPAGEDVVEVDPKDGSYLMTEDAYAELTRRDAPRCADDGHHRVVASPSNAFCLDTDTRKEDGEYLEYFVDVPFVVTAAIPGGGGYCARRSSVALRATFAEGLNVGTASSFNAKGEKTREVIYGAPGKPARWSEYTAGGHRAFDGRFDAKGHPDGLWTADDTLHPGELRYGVYRGGFLLDGEDLASIVGDFSE